LVAAHAEEELRFPLELILPGAMWEKARLDEVSARASAWLEAEV
jgi:hypothetical protein